MNMDTKDTKLERVQVRGKKETISEVISSAGNSLGKIVTWWGFKKEGKWHESGSRGDLERESGTALSKKKVSNFSQTKKKGRRGRGEREKPSSCFVEGRAL